MIASTKQALAFVQREENGCVVHIPDDVDTARIRKKIMYGFPQSRKTIHDMLQNMNRPIEKHWS